MTTRTDNFNRANENPIGSPWVSSIGGGAILSSNALTSGGTDRVSYYSDTWGADQESWGTVGNLVSGSNYAVIGVRLDSNGDGFAVVTDGAPGVGHTEFARYHNGAYTGLGGIATTFANGDRMRLTVSGTAGLITLTAYKDTGSGWVQVGQITGQTGPNSGAPGAGAYGDATVDDWGGTDGTAPEEPPPGLRSDRQRLDDVDLAFALADGGPEIAPLARAIYAPTAGTQINVEAARLVLNGGELSVESTITVSPAALALSGSAVTFAIASNVQPSALALSGRTLTTAFVSAIARGRLDLSGRQIGIAYTLSVAPSRLALTGRAASFATTLDVRPSSVVLTGRDVGLQATGTTTLDVVRGSLRLTGRDVGVLPQQDVILNVTRGALALTGRPLSAAIVQAVTRGSLTLAGRTLAVDLTNTLPITRGALQFAGRDVGIFVGANVDVAVDRGTLALSGRAPLLASQINVARGSAALTGRTVSMAVVGSFQLSIDRGALSIGGRTLALEIEVPAAVAPVDATMIGPRRRGRLYPNIRFEPVRRRKDEPPELVEGSVPGAGLGSRPPRQAPTAPGTGLRARGPAVAPAQQPTAPAPLPRAPQPPSRGRAAPAPTPAAPLALDVLPGHLTLPGPQEAFEQRVAAGYPSAAEIAALVHAEFEQAHLANEQRQREERRRARNQAAIDLAVKTLLGK